MSEKGVAYKTTNQHHGYLAWLVNLAYILAQII